MGGSDHVLHVASPFPKEQPKDEDEVIRPAVDGTLIRILELSERQGVKRVVLTSSFVAVGFGHTNYDWVFDEDDWTDINGPGVYPYIKSKVLSVEKAAWNFVNSSKGSVELTVMIPDAIFGRVGDPKSLSMSVVLVQTLLQGKMKDGCPKMTFGVSDARDVAKLQIKAMDSPSAGGRGVLLPTMVRIPFNRLLKS